MSLEEGRSILLFDKDKIQELEDELHLAPTFLGTCSVRQPKKSKKKSKNEQSFNHNDDTDTKKKVETHKDDDIPPVVLPSYMILSSSSSSDSCNYELNIKMSEEWASTIIENMKEANERRSKENMRSMTYQIQPEVWTRLRSNTTNYDNSTISNNNHNEEQHSSNKPQKTDIITSTTVNENEIVTNEEPMKSDCDTHLNSTKEETNHPILSSMLESSSSSSLINNDWFYIPWMDSDRMNSKRKMMGILFQWFQRTNPTFYISCGSKFGSDWLLYDGKRQDRHAFAGLRFYHPSEQKTMLSSSPSAYDIMGYVRGLNTAGKLALIATVSLPTQSIVIVDLVLEKIIDGFDSKDDPTTSTCGMTTKKRKRRKRIGSKHVWNKSKKNSST